MDEQDVSGDYVDHVSYKVTNESNNAGIATTVTNDTPQEEKTTGLAANIVNWMEETAVFEIERYWIVIIILSAIVLLAFVSAPSCCMSRKIKAYWRRTCCGGANAVQRIKPNGNRRDSETMALHDTSLVTTVKNPSMRTSTPMPKRKLTNHHNTNCNDVDNDMLNKEVLV